MNIFVKKSASIILASLIPAMSFPALAAEEKTNSLEQEQKIVSVEQEKLKAEILKKQTSKEKEHTASLWSKIPKSAKVFGGIALASVPVIIGGRIFYVNNVKPSVDFILGCKKLNTIRERFKNKTHRTDLDKMITALILIMPTYLLAGQSSEACLTQIELLQLSDEQIKAKINTLNSTELFRLSQLLQLEIAGLTLANMGNFRQAFAGHVPAQEVAEFDYILRDIPQLGGRTLNRWNSAVRPIISTKLQELNQRTLNKYELKIKRSLGSGQSGEVYLCTNKNGEEVAVKIMPQQGSLLSKLSIKNEKGIWQEVKELQSDNVVKYQDQFNGDGMACFTMEYSDGGKELSQVQPHDMNQVIDWAKQIFSGLVALHNRNIAHRDIKLENILINEATGQLKICDFGLAKRANSTVTVCGTPGMMAPEVQQHLVLQSAVGSIYDGKKFDVYSAAAVVYCLLFNKTSTDMVHEDSNILFLDERTNDRFGNAIGQNVCDFFKKCLSTNPKNRATATEALELLNHIS